MTDFAVLLDAPEQPNARLQIATLGDFQDKRYGKFSITHDDVASWQKNLNVLPGGRALIDLDHSADRSPRRTEAAGWITGVNTDGDIPTANIEWTPVGESAIREKRYLFFSPTYGNFTDERGNVHKNTLVGGALTNKPFLTGMPQITLASDERVSAALEDDHVARFYQHALDGELGQTTQALVMLDVSAGERKLALKEGNSLLQAAAHLAASGHGDAAAAKKLIRRRAKELGVDVTSLPGFADEKADSRRSMDTEILKTLGLPDDADDQKILDAVNALKADKTPEPEPTKTLEQQAADEGKIVLDSAKFAELSSNATAGKAAADELKRTRFETSFQNALDKGRAVPAQKEQLEKFYALDAENTLKMLDDGPQLVNVSPRGQSYDIEGDSVPNGVHPESYKLDQAVKAKLKEMGKGLESYPQALELVQRELEVGV